MLQYTTLWPMHLVGLVASHEHNSPLISAPPSSIEGSFSLERDHHVASYLRMLRKKRFVRNYTKCDV